MIAKILGVIWVVLGILWVAKPQVLRGRLSKKMTRRVKWIVFAFILVFGLSLIGSIIKAQGIFLKIVGLTGLIIVIKVILIITSKTSEKILEWWQGRPLLFFRIWGLFIFAIGAILIFGK